ncbi:MAG: DUF4278 domain-containing protein [Leptolyngbyaceae cyanobacterium SL_7_1]|nr:DUF4278 domain-containing protein [Leptolyngbyaceae cyanobacterium SL_7_1]
MKLTYRGVSYDYTPPTVEFSDSNTVGKYRGLDIRFRNPVKDPVQQPTLDLVYRGVAHQTHSASTVEMATPVTPVEVSIEAPIAQPVAPVTLSIEDRARSMMMQHHRSIKQRQQTMLSRLDAEVGLTASDAAHYWNHIQGKVHPSFRVTYDRSHAALS